MKPSKLDITRWILLFLSPILIILVFFCLNSDSENKSLSASDIIGVFSMLLWFFCTISILVLFIYKRTTISSYIKKLLVIIVPVSIIFYLIVNYLIKTRSDFTFILTFALVYFSAYSIILSFICYLEKAEIILLGFIVVIIIGFILNRSGLFEGAFLMFFGFCLSSLGFIYLVFRSIPLYSISKTRGMVFMVFYGVMAFLNALFLIKFMKANPALTNIYDTLGVIIYLLACLALFIMLPFLNYTEWPKTEKMSFKRLIITPLILFLFLFSLKFLLPDRIYRNIFFMEDTRKGNIHFGMEDYTIDFKSISQDSLKK